MRIAIISASPRPDSGSVKVANYLQQKFADKDEEAVLYSFEGFTIRSIGEGYLQPEELSEQQNDLVQIIDAAEIVVWVVPEYNRSVPAELVSFLHHFGAIPYVPQIWTDKLHAFTSVSSGVGGRGALDYCFRVFNYLIRMLSGKNTLVSPYAFQAMNTDKQFENMEFIGEESFEKSADKFVEELLG